jgi:hypothetical protein
VVGGGCVFRTGAVLEETMVRAYRQGEFLPLSVAKILGPPTLYNLRTVRMWVARAQLCVLVWMEGCVRKRHR